MMITLSQRLGSFRVESRAKIWHHWRQNKGGFHGLERRNQKLKSGKKISHFPSFLFSSPRHLFFLFFHCTFAASATTNHSSVFLTPLETQLATFLLRQGKFSLLFLLLKTSWLLHSICNGHDNYPMVTRLGQWPCEFGLDPA